MVVLSHCMTAVLPCWLFFAISPLSSVMAFGPTTPYRRRASSGRLHSQLDPGSFVTDGEWHPNDPAYTTPQLLVGIWDQIAMAKTMSKDVSFYIQLFCVEYFRNIFYNKRTFSNTPDSMYPMMFCLNDGILCW